MRRAAWAACLTLSLAGCHGVRGPDGRRASVVEAEGWAPLDMRDRPGSRARALAQAQRAAVEKASGVSVWALTRVRRETAFEQTVTARALGTIERYKVLRESEEDGFLKIVVRAWVRPSERTPDIEEEPIAVTGHPKVSVSVLNPSGKAEVARSAADGVRRELARRGFAVLEIGAPEESAELLVSGEVAVYHQEALDVAPMRSSRASLVLRARRRGTGEVLSQSSRSASAIQLAWGASESAAAERAGAAGGGELARELVASLERTAEPAP
ncbi:MAG: hypothetical protein HY077_09155 [Elusimicrobia bacterium]|nr:hypothetical protein [Elusimicrobiota bacterium]